MFEYDREDVAKNYAKFSSEVKKFMVPHIMSYLSEHKRKLNKDGDDDLQYDLMIDVGCGGGMSAIPFAKHFRSVVGYDISEEQIKMARKAKAPDNVVFEVAKGESIPALHTSADLIISGYAAHHMNFEKFINECSRIIKPSGIIAIYGSNVGDVLLDNFPEKADEKNKSVGHIYTTYREARMRHLKKIGHCDWHLLNRYQKIFRGDYGLKKFRNDELEFTESQSLTEFIRSLDYVPSWKEFNDEVEGGKRKNQQLEERFRRFWNIPNVCGSDITLKVVRSIYLLIFSL